LTSAAISFAGDFVAQKVVEGKEDLDVGRSARFTLIGASLSPIIHFWYKFCDRAFAGKPALLRLVIDQALFSTSLNAFFFSLLNLLLGKPGSIPGALSRNLLPTMLMSWRVWPVAQYINFNYVPANLRVLFGNLVGFFWSIFLSSRARS
jgi:hypothetical protein